MTINNEYYKSGGDIWWDPDQPLNTLQTVVNPARVGYFKRVIRDQLGLRPESLTALEIGCGGGILCEEIARLGFRTTGVDPSPQALDVGRRHARTSGLNIQYVEGSGEKLPFADRSFDAVFCCDVLEHVEDLDRVVSEISRVCKPGGHFFYDTINRTLISKIVMIKLWQDWQPFAFMPKNLHIWRMFIKPTELLARFEANGLRNQDMVGIGPVDNPVRLLYRLNLRARGRLSQRMLAASLELKETRSKSVLYAGFAIKK